MRIPSQNPHRALERRLRDHRPEPREELVDMLSPHAGTHVHHDRARHSDLTAAIVVLAVTVLFAGTLGVLGPVGIATQSVKRLGRNIEEVVTSGNHGPAAEVTIRAPSSNPFQVVNGAYVHVCQNGHVVFIPSLLWLTAFLQLQVHHGDFDAIAYAAVDRDTHAFYCPLKP